MLLSAEDLLHGLRNKVNNGSVYQKEPHRSLMPDTQREFMKMEEDEVESETVAN